MSFYGFSAAKNGTTTFNMIRSVNSNPAILPERPFNKRTSSPCFDVIAFIIFSDLPKNGKMQSRDFNTYANKAFPNNANKTGGSTAIANVKNFLRYPSNLNEIYRIMLILQYSYQATLHYLDYLLATSNFADSIKNDLRRVIA